MHAHFSGRFVFVVSFFSKEAGSHARARVAGLVAHQYDAPPFPCLCEMRPIWEDGGIVMLVRIGVIDCVLGSGFGREGHWMGVFIVLAYPVFCC